MRIHATGGASPAAPRGGAGRHALARLRRGVRQLGAAAIVSLGFLLELGWSFVGSLGLGLRPGGPAGALQAAAWIAGVVLIAASAAGAALLAVPGRRGLE